MPAGLGFIVQAILGMMGSQSLLHVGALSVRLSEGFLVLMAVCSVRSSCVLYLVVVSMVVLSQAILFVCKIPLLARALCLKAKKAAARRSSCATLGHLVYKYWCLYVLQ